MSKIEFRTFIDMLTVATPSSGYAIGYDLDGTLKQKDQFGVISPIGATGGIGPAGPTGIGVTGSSGPQGATGPSSATPSFAQVLAVDNNSGTYSIVMGTSSSIKSSNGNGQIDLDYDGTYSHVYITSDNGVLLESVLEVSNHYTGLAAKNYFMGFEAYDLGNERSTNLWSTFTSSIINIGVSKDYYSTYYEYQDIAVHENTTSVSVSDHNRHAIFIGTRNSSFSAGITNSVIIGGYSMSATVSNTVYLGNNVNINNAYTLPNTDGASGYVLKTDGSGIVTWQADTNTTPSLSQTLAVGNNDGGYSITMNTSSYISDTSNKNTIIFNDGYLDGGLSITTDNGLFQKSWLYFQKNYLGTDNYIEMGAVATSSSTASLYFYVSDDLYNVSSSLFIGDNHVSLYKSGTPFSRSISIYDNMIQTLGNEEHLGWINLAFSTIGASYTGRLNVVENEFAGTSNYVLRTSTDNSNVIFGVRANKIVHIGTTSSSATFSYINGSQGAGKYLQSDANGNATWVTIASGTTNKSVDTRGFTASIAETITHNLNTNSVIVQNYDSTGLQIIAGSVSITGTGSVSIAFSQTLSSVKTVIIG